MVTTLSEGQTNLPRLVELASQGEDVVITVDGKPKAKLTRPEITPSQNGSGTKQRELVSWLKELETLREKYSTGKTGPTVEALIAEDRADRV
jgi:antitoxin (DNA-binding transcriptional repressor) of toxin-antitoxin stability system